MRSQQTEGTHLRNERLSKKSQRQVRWNAGINGSIMEHGSRFPLCLAWENRRNYLIDLDGPPEAVPGSGGGESGWHKALLGNWWIQHSNVQLLCGSTRGSTRASQKSQGEAKNTRRKSAPDTRYLAQYLSQSLPDCRGRWRRCIRGSWSVDWGKERKTVLRVGLQDRM